MSKCRGERTLNHNVRWFNWWEDNNNRLTCSPLYDFDLEKEIVHKCEAGELLHIEEVITPHTAFYNI